MRLVEIVMLMGAHCVSPVEHGQMMTDAAKVQCAVMIEKETETGTLTVTPPEAARDPQVAAAMQRFAAAPVDPNGAETMRIVPAWAPAGTPPTETKLPVAIAPTEAPAPTPPPTATAPSAPAVGVAPPRTPQKVASLVTPAPKRAAAETTPSASKTPAAKVQKAKAKPTRNCKAGTVAKWYKTDGGERKLRCVAPPDRTPAQLY